MLAYFWLVLGWIVYFALHSVMAMDELKSKFPVRAYRIIYVLISSIGLLALLFYNASIPALKFFVNTGPVRYLSLMLTTFGVMVVQSSFRQYNLRGFLGVVEEKKELRTDGVLQYVRHPILAGVILIVLGFFFFIPNLPTLISCACIIVYIPIGMHFEEKKLIRLFGDAYREYKKKVPALVPNLNKAETKN